MAPRRGDGEQKSTRNGHWKSLPLTRPSANGRLSMLVATARRVAPSKPNTVVSGSLPAKEPAPATEPQGFQFLRLSLPAGGIVVFTRNWYKPPRLGGAPGRGEYIRSGRGYRGRGRSCTIPDSAREDGTRAAAPDAQPVRCGPAHAEKGPGADPLVSGAPVPSAAKAGGRAHPDRGASDVGGERPREGRPLPTAGPWGAPGPDGRRTCRRSRLRPPIGRGGPGFKGPPVPREPSPTAQAPSPPAGSKYPAFTPLLIGQGPPGPARTRRGCSPRGRGPVGGRSSAAAA